MFKKERAEIDAIDKELVKLFERRMDAVTEVARIKKKYHLPVLDQEREDKVLEKVRNLTENKAYAESMVQLYKHLMNVTKDFEEERNK